VVRAWVKYIFVETPRRGRWPDFGLVGEVMVVLVVW
jgi:hypothetical protein